MEVCLLERAWRGRADDLRTTGMNRKMAGLMLKLEYKVLTLFSVVVCCRSVRRSFSAHSNLAHLQGFLESWRTMTVPGKV